MIDTTDYHIPVLLDETLDALAIKPKGLYFDVTFGGGGHSTAILQKDQTINVIGFDWDQNAIDHAQPIIDQFDGRLQVIWSSFVHLYKQIKKHKLKQPDGILADFGTSQFQISERDGFSVYNSTALDMRMSLSHFQVTAEQIVNQATEQELCQIFWDFGQERHAKKIVKKIIETRQKTPITTTTQLAKLVESVVGRPERIHPATRIFQALRIVVNHELDNIESFLPAAFQALKPGGRLVCITFHSLEDRIVKQFFRQKVAEGAAIAISKKAITACPQELEINKSARSAQLRVIEKK